MIIAQISDPHIPLPGTPFDARFSPMDGLMITGDLVEDGTPEAYQRFKQRVDALGIPYYVIPGNHDHRQHLLASFGRQGTSHHHHYVQYVIHLDSLQIIALDTLNEGFGHGRLCRDRLTWLEERLKEKPNTPTIIMMHHPPFEVGLPAMDAPPFEGRASLGSTLDQYKHVERLVAGHVHCHVQRRFHGTVALTCPSTTLQVFPDLNQCGKQWGVMSTPFCLLHYMSETTGLVTHACPIEDREKRLVHNGEHWIELE